MREDSEESEESMEEQVNWYAVRCPRWQWRKPEKGLWLFGGRGGKPGLDPGALLLPSDEEAIGRVEGWWAKLGDVPSVLPPRRKICQDEYLVPLCGGEPLAGTLYHRVWIDVGAPVGPFSVATGQTRSVDIGDDGKPVLT